MMQIMPILTKKAYQVTESTPRLSLLVLETIKPYLDKSSKALLTEMPDQLQRELNSHYADLYQVNVSDEDGEIPTEFSDHLIISIDSQHTTH